MRTQEYKEEKKKEIMEKCLSVIVTTDLETQGLRNLVSIVV